MLIEMSAGVVKTADILFSLVLYLKFGPIATEDEQSISNGGAESDAENKVDPDALKEANRPESSPESSKKEPACEVK